MSEDFLSKPDFCARHGISARTVDAWVRKGRVERVLDIDGRAYFHLLPPGSPAAPPQPPAWAAEIVERQARIEAKLDALLAAAPPLLGSGTDAGPGEQPGSAPSTRRVSWWRRLLR